jgi:hypothetical protein
MGAGTKIVCSDDARITSPDSNTGVNVTVAVIGVSVCGL